MDSGCYLITGNPNNNLNLNPSIIKSLTLTLTVLLLNPNHRAHRRTDYRRQTEDHDTGRPNGRPNMAVHFCTKPCVEALQNRVPDH